MQIIWIQLSDYKTTLQMNKDINMRKIVPRKNQEDMKKRRKPDFISLKEEKDKENCRSNSLKNNDQP